MPAVSIVLSFPFLIEEQDDILMLLPPKPSSVYTSEVSSSREHSKLC